MEYGKIVSDITYWFITTKTVIKIIRNTLKKDYKKSIVNVVEAGSDMIIINAVMKSLIGKGSH